MCATITKAFALAMGFMIATNVSGGAIRHTGDPETARDADIHEKEPISHGTRSLNKRSPIINPLFPIKYPATLLLAELYGLAGGKLLGKIPGFGLFQELFWKKKVLIAKGK